jgi:hypothetical protein
MRDLVCGVEKIMRDFKREVDLDLLFKKWGRAPLIWQARLQIFYQYFFNFGQHLVNRLQKISPYIPVFHPMTHFDEFIISS